jgi:hypothetical protein
MTTLGQTIKELLRRYRYALVGLALVWFAAGSLRFVHEEIVLLRGYDHTAHYASALRLADAVVSGEVSVAEALDMLPARYTPLTYAVAAAYWLAGLQQWAFPTTIFFFWLLAGLGLVYVGWRIFPDHPLAVLPVATWLAMQTTWQVGLAFNLEMGVLAAGAWLPVLFLFAPQSRWLIPAAAAVFCLVMAKAVVLVAVLPLAVVLAAGASGRERRRSLVLLAAALAPFFLWYLVQSSLGAVWNELAEDVTNERMWQGFDFYPSQVLFRDRLLLLVVALIALVAAPPRRPTRQTLAVALYFIVPTVFFSLIDTKQPWYLAGPALALPVWFLLEAQRRWDRRWVRIVAWVVLVPTVGLAIATSSALTRVAAHGHDPALDTDMVATQQIDHDSLADQVVRAVRSAPAALVLVDLTHTRWHADTLRLLCQTRDPDQTYYQPLIVLDEFGAEAGVFALAVPEATQVISVNGGWPRLPTEGALAQRLAASRAGFTVRGVAPWDGGSQVTLFTRLAPRVGPELPDRYKLKRTKLRNVNPMAMLGREYRAAGKPVSAAWFFRLALVAAGEGGPNSNMWEALADSLNAAGDDQAGALAASMAGGSAL